MDAGEGAGLYPRRYKKSVMLTPPQNKTRCAIYLPTQHRKTDRATHAYVATDVFEEFFGISQDKVSNTIGQEWVEIREENVEQFVRGLAGLLEESSAES